MSTESRDDLTYKDRVRRKWCIKFLVDCDGRGVLDSCSPAESKCVVGEGKVRVRALVLGQGENGGRRLPGRGWFGIN